MNDKIYDYGFEDGDGEFADFLRSQLVGSKIQSIEGNRIILDNSRVVEFEGYGECCAWGDLDKLELLVSGEHVITSVDVIESDEWYTCETRFFIYSSGIPLASGEMSGDEGTGYYSFGVMVTGTVVA